MWNRETAFSVFMLVGHGRIQCIEHASPFASPIALSLLPSTSACNRLRSVLKTVFWRGRAIDVTALPDARGKLSRSLEPKYRVHYRMKSSSDRPALPPTEHDLGQPD